jgi:hypothetical protein
MVSKYGVLFSMRFRNMFPSDQKEEKDSLPLPATDKVEGNLASPRQDKDFLLRANPRDL